MKRCRSFHFLPVLMILVGPSFANRFAARVMQTRLLTDGSKRPGPDGSSEIVGIADTGIDIRHVFFHDPLHEVPVCSSEDARSNLSRCVNFQHRKIVSYRLVKPGLAAGSSLMVHGTHIAGILAGGANDAIAKYNGHSAAKLVFDDILAEGEIALSVPSEVHKNLFPHSYAIGARIHSNSWGTVLSAYTHQSRDVDQFVWDHHDFVILFAAMNSGPSSYTVASPGTAKNAICVGSSTNIFESRDNNERTEHMIAMLTIETGPPGTVGTQFFILSQAQTCIKQEAHIKGRLVFLSTSDVCTKAYDHSACSDCVWLVQEGAGCSALTLAARARQEGALAVITFPRKEGTLPSLMSWKSPLPTFTVEPATAKLLSSLQDRQKVRDHDATSATHLRVTIQRAAPSLTQELWQQSRLSWFSSRGPTFPDGRFKPDILCPGENIASSGPFARPKSDADITFDRIVTQSGTSMATPACAGAAAIVRQYLREGWFRDGNKNSTAGIQPAASLVKAMLIHSARQVRVQPDDSFRNTTTSLPPGWTAGFAPTPAQGFGLVGLDAVLQHTASSPGLRSMHIVNGAKIGPTQQYRMRFTVHTNSSRMLRATLAWTDPPGPNYASKALVNDLDLLLHTPDGTMLLGNGLALRGGTVRADVVNNVEQVSVASPAPGDYTLVVAGVWINPGPQPFSLVVTGDWEVQREEGPGLLSDMRCNNDCGGRGQCRGGSCRCEGGFFGAGCEVEVRCGDGEVEAELEDCDDGNTGGGDGCSAQCSLEPGFVCPRTSGAQEGGGGGCVECGCEGGCVVLEGAAGSFGASFNASDAQSGPSSPRKSTPSEACFWTIPVGWRHTQVSVRPSRALAAGAANLKSLLEVTWCADHSCRQSEELGEVQAAGGGYRAWTGWVRVWMLRPPELQKEAVTIMSGSWGAAGRVCGDFFVEGEEGCDDGNTEEGDGCSSACQVEEGFCCWPRGETSRWMAAGSVCERKEGSLCGAPCLLEPLCADVLRSSAAADILVAASSGGTFHARLILASCCLIALLHTIV